MPRTRSCLLLPAYQLSSRKTDAVHGRAKASTTTMCEVGRQAQAPTAASLKKAQTLEAPAKIPPEARQTPPTCQTPARGLPKQTGPQDIHGERHSRAREAE